MPLISGAALAAWRTGKRLLTTQPLLAPPKVEAARVAICHSCDQWLPDSNRCALCKCYLRPKTHLAAESCPDNPKRWDVYL